MCIPIGIRGIRKSNDVSLSSVDKLSRPIATLYFNKDGYSIYCKDYREYWDWVDKRNVSRFSDNMLHGGGYDGKNLAHCHRLLDMAIEIGQGKGINVRRNNRDQLLSIRRGEYSYETLIDEANQKIELLDKVYETSSLPEEVDQKLVEKILLEIRKEKYKI